MGEAEQCKWMFTETGRVSFDLEKQSGCMENFKTLTMEIKLLQKEFNRMCNQHKEIDQGYEKRISELLFLIDVGVKELENQEALRLIDEVDLKCLLGDCGVKYDRLLVKFQEKKIEWELIKGELKEMNESKIGVENQVKEYEIMRGRLKEQIRSLEEDKGIASDRIISLEEEIKEKFEEFSKEIVGLQGANRRAEDEIETWKKKYTDLECEKRRADDEIDILKQSCMELEIKEREMLDHGAELEDCKTKCQGLSTLLKVKVLECVEFEGTLKNLMSTKAALEHELEDCKNTCSGMEEEIMGLRKTMSESDKVSQERIAYLDELAKVLELGKRRAEDEINILKKMCMELEIQVTEMLNHRDEFEDYKTKCRCLSTALKVKQMECVEFEGKLKNLMSAKVALDHELEDYKTTCSGMEEEITGLQKIMSEKEKTSQERIACLYELVKVLECGKRKAEADTENWKKRFSELEMGLGGLQEEATFDNICKKYMDDYIRRKMDGRVIAAKSEKVLSPAPSSNFSSYHGDFEDVHVSDTPNIKNQNEHSATVQAENKNICSDKVQLVNEVRQQPGSESGGSCKENLTLLKQGGVTTSSTCIIEIDSEDEVIEASQSEYGKKIHTCNNKGEDTDHASTDETLNNNLKRPLSVWGSRDKDIPFPSTLKRCKISNTSQSVNQEDDKFPNIVI